MVRQLEAATVTMSDGTPPSYLAVRDRAMHSLGVGTMHDMRSVPSGIFWPSLRSRHYTPGEKIKIWRGKLSSGVSALWDGAGWLRRALAPVPANRRPSAGPEGVG